MDSTSKAWIAASLLVILCALVLDPLAHEPQLCRQMHQDGRAGVQVASKSIRSGLRTTSARAGAVVTRLGRMMRGK